MIFNLVSGGVVSVLPNSTIQILAEEAALPEDFDTDRINAGISKHSAPKGDEKQIVDGNIALEVYNFLSAGVKVW